MNRTRIGSLAVGVLGVALAIVVVGGVVRHQNASAPAPAATASAPAADKPASDAASPAKKSSSAAGIGAAGQAADLASIPAAGETASSAEAGQDQSKPAIAGLKSVVPSFDILRVEPDGSTVIAGRAAPYAQVSIMAGKKRLATTKSDENGDFVAVLDPPLAPGDYELSLQATGKDKTIVSSVETATVSVPKDKKSDLLAMVTKPGAASRIVTAPKPETLASAAAGPDSAKPAAEPLASAEAALGTPAQEPAKAARLETKAASPGDRPSPQDATAGDHVRVDAVEIEGDKLYVAGSATTGRKVRVYADDKVAGEDRATSKGRFVVESSIDLKPGQHTIRADLIDPDTGEVVMRATVPFTRPTGDQFVAVAPPTDAKGSVPSGTVQPSAEAQSADASSPVGGAGPKTIVQPALTNSDDFVIIRRGDTLWQIARRVYGRGVRYTTIYLANTSQISDPDLILPGQIFDVPAKSLPDAEKVHRRLQGGERGSG